MLLARPAAVFIFLALTRFSFKENLLIAWVGLRGAVPIILATFPLLAEIPNAGHIFNLVFFIVLTSVLFQGTSIPLVVRYLGLATSPLARPRYALEFEDIEGDRTLIDFIIPYNSAVVEKAIVDLKLPEQSVITVISRNNQYIAPTGSTRLQGGDVLLIILNKASVAEVSQILSAPKPQ